MVGENKRNACSQPKSKGKSPTEESSKGSKRNAKYNIPHVNDPKESTSFHCNQKGHWKRIRLKYLQETKDGKAKVSGSSFGMYMIKLYNTKTSYSWVLDTRYGFRICSDMQDLKESEKLKHGELNLIMGNRHIVLVMGIGIY